MSPLLLCWHSQQFQGKPSSKENALECIGWATGWGSPMPAGCPGSGDIPPRSPPGARAGTQHGRESHSLNLREGKTKLDFSGRIHFHSKLTPIKRGTQVLHAGWNTGACVQLWQPLGRADSSEHAVLGAISKSWTITKKNLNSFYILHQRCHYKNTIASHIN